MLPIVGSQTGLYDPELTTLVQHSDFRVHQNHNPVKTLGVGVSLRIHISRKFPDDVGDTALLRITEKAGLSRWQ